MQLQKIHLKTNSPGGGTPGEGGHQEAPGELKAHHLVPGTLGAPALAGCLGTYRTGSHTHVDGVGTCVGPLVVTRRRPVWG